MRKLALIMIGALVLTGCGSSSTKTSGTGVATVDDVLTAQVESAEEESSEEVETEEVVTTMEEVVEDVTEEVVENVDSTEDVVEDETVVADSETSDSDVDYDLTTMSASMVYTTIYNMLVDPDSYTGKTVRMSGQYYASYYDVTDQYYNYCIIADATACCSQGMEFLLSDESCTYPDDFPEDYTEITVVGTFGTYEELGYTYACLMESCIE